MSVIDRNDNKQEVFAVSHKAPSSVDSAAVFFKRREDAFSALSRMKADLDVYPFQAPIDSFDRSVTTNSLFESAVHYELAEKLMNLTNTAAFNEKNAMAQAEIQFSALIKEMPRNRKILENVIDGSLPVRQATMVMVNGTRSLSMEVVATRLEGEALAESRLNKYEPNAILSRSVDNHFKNDMSAFYDKKTKRHTGREFLCNHATAEIEGKTYFMDVEYDYAPNDPDKNTLHGLNIGSVMLEGPYDINDNDMLEIDGENVKGYHVIGFDARMLIERLHHSNDNPDLVKTLVNTVKDLQATKHEMKVDIDLDYEMKMGRM